MTWHGICTLLPLPLLLLLLLSLLLSMIAVEVAAGRHHPPDYVACKWHHTYG
jgi:hypothetical protein